jgi:3-dehydroquinate dehydratase-1
MTWLNWRLISWFRPGMVKADEERLAAGSAAINVNGEPISTSPAPAWDDSRLPGPVNVVGSLIAPIPNGLEPQSVMQGCDVVEFRLDAFAHDMSAVRSLMTASPAPVLVTARDPREGGKNSLGLSPRRALLLSLLDEADLVDVEIANLGVLGDVVGEARESNVLVVGSYHDFQGLPPRQQLDDMAAEARSVGVDIVKFALTLSQPADLVVLTSLLDSAAPGSLSVMGMGPLGPVSRLLCGQLGSVLNYGYLDEATIPGQWPAAELKRLLTWLRQ